MERLRVKYPIIVEGRYDKARLASFIEGDILQTDGFQVFSDKKKLALIRRLAAEEKVAVVPGDSFGECGEGFVRISYAASLQNLKEAVNRIFRFLSRYRT